jgi:hypothetical protein
MATEQTFLDRINSDLDEPFDHEPFPRSDEPDTPENTTYEFEIPIQTPARTPPSSPGNRSSDSNRTSPGAQESRRESLRN